MQKLSTSNVLILGKTVGMEFAKGTDKECTTSACMHHISPSKKSIDMELHRQLRQQGTASLHLYVQSPNSLFCGNNMLRIWLLYLP